MTEALSTRLGRVIQQLRSFDQLHASELEVVALELDASEVRERIRGITAIQRDELQMIVNELIDIRNDLAVTAQPAPPAADPNASPRYQKWVAEQAAEAERLKQPLSRRDLFDRVANPGGDEANAVPAERPTSV